MQEIPLFLELLDSVQPAILAQTNMSVDFIDIYDLTIMICLNILLVLLQLISNIGLIVFTKEMEFQCTT